ncbi:hypothetical protein L291_2541 [Acinetobacter guillouiae MSP4-18]|uniref:hypothetical protein n=1 Tax=Acinetobacter guillouiae TaxID=106649 RepID=UPI0002D0AADB|nr:hypothetical protein [Acinetobacter guillouiae]ENU59095.1 hypothetical protein F981_03404 [Acinetobacter guillouiae CIP 63.46]EPH33767.1 hypothetical protein L291_2541 [Acinetobacter guillouiae MSP4-18]KAB0625267.1 hypothetical protein F7P82_16160 [Acinetobacter guillouiae]
MELKYIYVIVALLSCSGLAYANDYNDDAVKKCFDFGIKQNGGNSKILDITHFKKNSIIINRFDRKLGKQYISTEIMGKIYKSEKEQWRFVCLLEDSDHVQYFALLDDIYLNHSGDPHEN